MMRAVRKSTLFVAFYLLTSAGPAGAECAWVLWSKGQGNSDIGNWEPEKAGQTLTDCQANMNQALNSMLIL